MENSRSWPFCSLILVLCIYTIRILSLLLESQISTLCDIWERWPISLLSWIPYLPPSLISFHSFLITASQSTLQALFFLRFLFMCLCIQWVHNKCLLNWMTLPLNDQSQVYQETDSLVLGTKGVPEFGK